MSEDGIGDIFAVLIFALALAAPWLSPAKLKISTSEHVILFTATSVRILLCFLSVAEVFLPPVSDSLDFHLEALAVSSGAQSVDFSEPGVRVFTGIQALLYDTLGPSLLLADAIGVLAFSAASVVFLSLVRRIWGAQVAPVSLALFCFAPAGLLYANFNYREPFQILCMLLGVLFAVRYRANARIGDLFASAIFLLLFAAVHAKFFVIAPLVIVATVLVPSGNRISGSFGKVPGFAIALFATALFAVWMNLSATDNEIARAVSTGSISDYVADIGSSATSSGARTTMPYFPTGQSSVDLLALSPFLFIQYSFAPLFPWLVTQSQDLVALVDTLLRLCAMVSCLFLLSRVRGERHRTILFLLVIYLSASFVASLGTWTVGTAMRHQIKSSWLLLVVAAPMFSHWLGSMFGKPHRMSPFNNRSSSSASA